mmetsp:Transcript_26663/g.39737  ORF Transcript_26663/g.39737 Transcript_26663/m.39737 type:complete len:125 (-) Transcript_26663:97-471(-)
MVDTRGGATDKAMELENRNGTSAFEASSQNSSSSKARQQDEHAAAGVAALSNMPDSTIGTAVMQEAQEFLNMESGNEDPFAMKNTEKYIDYAKKVFEEMEDKNKEKRDTLEDVKKPTQEEGGQK